MRLIHKPTNQPSMYEETHTQTSKTALHVLYDSYINPQIGHLCMSQLIPSLNDALCLAITVHGNTATQHHRILGNIKP